jgi:hypothetical protein
VSLPTASNKAATVRVDGFEGLVRRPAGIAEVRRYGRDPGGAGILQARDEEQKTADLVLGADLRLPVEALQDIDVRALDGVQGAPVVFTLLEVAFLVRGQRLTQRLRRPRADSAGVALRAKS